MLITKAILDNIHHPVCYLERNISETGFSLPLEVEPMQFGPVDRASPCLLLCSGC
jgi:hypothetical protein